MHTFMATLLSSVSELGRFLAMPSNTSPKAPLPKNFVSVIWSLLIWGKAAISSSVGISADVYRALLWWIKLPRRGSSLSVASSTSGPLTLLKTICSAFFSFSRFLKTVYIYFINTYFKNGTKFSKCSIFISTLVSRFLLKYSTQVTSKVLHVSDYGFKTIWGMFIKIRTFGQNETIHTVHTY